MMAVLRSILDTILTMRHCYQSLTTPILPIDYPPPHTHIYDAHVSQSPPNMYNHYFIKKNNTQ